jgi:hypothetical protein
MPPKQIFSNAQLCGGIEGSVVIAGSHFIISSPFV